MATDTSRIIPGYGGTTAALTASLTIAPGDSLDLSADALRNTLGENLLIDCLRWTVDAQTQQEIADPAVTQATQTFGFPGGGAEIDIKMGDKEITAGEIPIYCLGRADGQDVETAILAVQDDTNTNMYLGSYTASRWFFDHPMSMAPGDAFICHITNHGLLNLPITVSIALTGRVGPDLPVSRWIPYCASWTPPAFTPSLATATVPLTATSTERDLVNRAPAQLHISRFVGRLGRIGVVGAPFGGNTISQNAEMVFPGVQQTVSGQPTSNWFPSAVDSFLTLTMRDSRANDNIPTAIPFRMAFEPTERTWECAHILDPQGYYIASLTLAVPSVIDASLQPSIAMVGSYEVP
ncbi:MAG TPA: hypothetical protein VLY82_03160 [Nitrososphaerales archaeon]|nr:hypothetical protein [Nitrososphaerales archaeon]